MSVLKIRGKNGEFHTVLTIRGDDGYTPVKGVDYSDGVDGKSAYEVAVEQGFVGTEAEWLTSLHGADGKDGKDGQNGADGKDGKDGQNGADGKDGVDGEKGDPGESGVYIGTDEPTEANVWIDPSGEPTSMVNDVQINGTSIVADGVANIPIASLDKFGTIRADAYNGIYVNSNGILSLLNPTTSQIDNRIKRNYPITLREFDYAVKAAMCDGKGAEWTAEEQAMARERMDADGVYRHIAYVEITEEGIINIGFDVDINGNPFSLSDIKIYGFIKRTTSNFNLAVALNNKLTSINGGYNIIRFPANGVSSEIHINKAKYWRASAFTSQSSDGILGGTTGYAMVSHRGASIVRNNEWEKVSSLSICTSDEKGFAVGTTFDIWGR